MFIVHELHNILFLAEHTLWYQLSLQLVTWPPQKKTHWKLFWRRLTHCSSPSWELAILNIFLLVSNSVNYTSKYFLPDINHSLFLCYTAYKTDTTDTDKFQQSPQKQSQGSSKTTAIVAVTASIVVAAVSAIVIALLIIHVWRRHQRPKTTIVWISTVLPSSSFAISLYHSPTLVIHDYVSVCSYACFLYKMKKI